MKVVLKNVFAVIAGFITVFVLSTVTDLILQVLKLFPDQNYKTAYVWYLLLIALIYRCIYTVLGGYVTAKISANKPLVQVTILGILGTIAGIGGIIAGWKYGAHWYAIALAVTAFPCIWLGYKIFVRQTPSQL
ncbi:MAG TPA: hypothetical protein VLI92_00740 [Candidatus Saccharimonadales bacterium]|nr:hypothetical protein [Candidatus Saccharimonadales bacterium]